MLISFFQSQLSMLMVEQFSSSPSFLQYLNECKYIWGGLRAGRTIPPSALHPLTSPLCSCYFSQVAFGHRLPVYRPWTTLRFHRVSLTQPLFPWPSYFVLRPFSSFAFVSSISATISRLQHTREKVSISLALYIYIKCKIPTFLHHLYLTS